MNGFGVVRGNHIDFAIIDEADFGLVDDAPESEEFWQGVMALQERIRQERIIHALGVPLTDDEYQLLSASSAGIELVLA